MNDGDGNFNAVLGDDLRLEVEKMIREQFNMDGMDPSGRKVALLDRVHLMCFLVDPFNHQWLSTVLLQTNRLYLCCGK